MKILWIVFWMTLTSAVVAGDLRDVVNSMTDVSIEVLAGGQEVLAASNGLTLYTFDNDSNGVSTCFGACLAAWPVIATELDQVPAPFSIHVRPDGVKQLVLGAQPLYFFVGDSSAGDINGDGLGGVWHIIKL